MSLLTATRAGLPGVELPGRPAAARPERLLAPGSLLLADVQPGQPVGAAEHRAQWGAAPHLDLATLVARVRDIDLRGAGGAGFPTGHKLESLGGARVGEVVVNGAEGEATSAKDGVLLSHVPHLVLDGAATAAWALGATRVVVRVAEDRPWLAAAVAAAIGERRDGLRFRISLGPARFIAGEATAVIRSLHGGAAAPADLGLPPRAPRRGLAPRRHVFLSNAETFARLAVAARGDVRTSALVTVSGAVTHAGVAELPNHVTLSQLAAAVGVQGQPRFLITGGWHGAWVRWPDAAAAQLTRESLAAAGGRWGAGALVWLPEDVDPRTALTAIVAELAGESAGQCGPCVSGLPELAGASRRAEYAPTMPPEVARLLDVVDGRGLCAHPTATAAAVRSAWSVIGGTDVR